MVCKKALEDGSPPPDLADMQIAWLNLPGREPAPIVVGFQSDFVALMLAVEHGSSEEPPPPPSKEPSHGSSSLMDRLVDIELPMAVVLGRARVRVQDALKLTTGSLVELDSRSGDSVEIVVHNAVVARGEVVSVGGNYGVKIREVISRSDRVALQTSASRSPRGTVQRS
jgi:flagellar motor switch protein FliN/FliY